ncbi:hypothetical protein CW749_27250 [Vibrio sp. vnigr-6D03]|nr:hypothetical protein CW749_27250 [Vibrio sp. vnigr-6D03]
MEFYIFIITILWLIYLGGVTSKSKSIIFEYFSFLILFLFSSNSYFNGWDAYTYLRYFNVIVDKGNYEGFSVLYASGLEIGYIAILSFSALISDNFQFYILIQSLIVNTLLWFGVRKLDLNFSLFALLFFCASFTRLEMSTFRQGISFSIFVFSLPYLINGSRKYIFTILFATLFHFSSVVLLMLWLVKKLELKIHVLIALAAIPMWYVTLGLYNLFLSTTSILPDSLSFIVLLLEHYSQYRQAGLSVLTLVNLAIYSFLIFVFYSYKIEITRIPLLNTTMVLFGSLILLQFYTKFMPSLIVSRFEYYFSVSLIILIQLIPTYAIGFRKHSPLIMLPLSLLMFFITFRYHLDREVYFPYTGYVEYLLFGTPPRAEEYIYRIGLDY